jgi:transcription termination factor NusB
MNLVDNLKPLLVEYQKNNHSILPSSLSREIIETLSTACEYFHANKIRPEIDEELTTLLLALADRFPEGFSIVLLANKERAILYLNEHFITRVNTLKRNKNDLDILLSDIIEYISWEEFNNYILTIPKEIRKKKVIKEAIEMAIDYNTEDEE